MMLVTSFTRQTLGARRARKQLLRQGYEEIGEAGGRLWELHRGRRIGQRIVDVKIGPEGRSVFVKVSA